MARESKKPGPRADVAGDLAARAAEIRRKYGPSLGWGELQALLKDRTVTPFPCEVRFDAAPLLPGEFGHPIPKGLRREDGFILCLHPRYAGQASVLPYLVLHQLVLASYGSTATAEDAEIFGSIALGLSKEAYYRTLCDLSSLISAELP